MRTRPRTLACPIEVRFDAGNDNCMGGKGVVEDNKYLDLDDEVQLFKC